MNGKSYPSSGARYLVVSGGKNDPLPGTPEVRTATDPCQLPGDPTTFSFMGSKLMSHGGLSAETVMGNVESSTDP